MRIKKTGRVQINEHTIELPEADARVLFLAAAALTRKPGALAIDQHTTIAITSNTHVAITITDGFTDDYNPQAALDQATRGRQAVVL